MKAFNCEIFTPNFEYVGNGQTDDVKYTFDYLDSEKNSVELKCKASIGDYIVMKNDEFQIYGVIVGVSPKGSVYHYSYKPLNSIFDVDIFARFSDAESVEQTISRLISENYVNNADVLQNINGLSVEILTETDAEYGLNFADGKVNLFDLILEAFTTYGIVCDFAIDNAEKEIILTIEKVDFEDFNIEPNLPNIIDKTINLKKTRETKNKVTIYDADNLDNIAIYYRDENDEITQNPTSRILPVNFTTKSVNVSSNQTFEEKALSAAASTLKASKYENLMEFKTASTDLLLRPLYRSIGQKANVYMNGSHFVTILTGYSYNNGVSTLTFGLIRLELTKQLKKSWR